MRVGRYDNPHACVSFSHIDSAVVREPVALTATDGGISTAILYQPPGARTVVCFMHPQADMSRHYAIPGLVDAGFAAFGQNSRCLNNDTHCVHELLLLDVAAGQRFLRRRGFDRIVLVGNSGGGSLFSLYQAEACSADRLQHTPAGDPIDLGAQEMPPADGLVLLAAHLGEGKILARMIDPSVTDENDPTSCDPELDPYDRANGYRPPPDSSHYSAEFVERYRAAQDQRVRRIDEIARSHIELRNQAREELRSGLVQGRDAPDHTAWARRAVAHPPMVVHRTEADLRSLDLSLDPSQRDAGTLFSYRPDLTNYMELGFARVTTPKAWLSTWSAFASNASLERNAPKIDAPALVVGYDGDNAIFPSDNQRALQLLGSPDKQLITVPGDHYGFGIGTQERSGAPRAVGAIADWLRDRFPDPR